MTAKNIIIATGSVPFVPPGIQIDGKTGAWAGRMWDFGGGQEQGWVGAVCYLAAIGSCYGVVSMWRAHRMLLPMPTCLPACALCSVHL